MLPLSAHLLAPAELTSSPGARAQRRLDQVPQRDGRAVLAEGLSLHMRSDGKPGPLHLGLRKAQESGDSGWDLGAPSRGAWRMRAHT